MESYKLTDWQDLRKGEIKIYAVDDQGQEYYGYLQQIFRPKYCPQKSHETKL